MTMFVKIVEGPRTGQVERIHEEFDTHVFDFVKDRYGSYEKRLNSKYKRIPKEEFDRITMSSTKE